MEQEDAELLLAAAYLHDVGYAPELVESGFHALDGARFVRDANHARLAGLVAYHSGAQAEAVERRREAALSQFDDERSAVSCALTYCDLTTDSEGHRVDPVSRLAEIRERYGSASPEVRALERSGDGLLDDVRAVEAMLAAKGMIWAEHSTRLGGRR